MNKIAKFIKENRRATGLTQEEFAIRSGLGLRFIRELEQGKETVRMDKVNVALAMFDMEAVPGRKDKKAFLKCHKNSCKILLKCQTFRNQNPLKCHFG